MIDGEQLAAGSTLAAALSASPAYLGRQRTLTALLRARPPFWQAYLAKRSCVCQAPPPFRLWLLSLVVVVVVVVIVVVVQS